MEKPIWSPDIYMKGRTLRDKGNSRFRINETSQSLY